MTPISKWKVCGRASRPVYELNGAIDRLAAIYPDAEHSFPKAARIEAYRFLDRFLAPPSQGTGRP
jgi:hypothetical protein